MNNLWSDERNRLAVDTVKAELRVRLNFDCNCSEFYEQVKGNVKLLENAKSNTKYRFKIKKI